MSDTETPEQWADRIYCHCRAYRPDAENARRTLEELAAVKRKADACDLWRAEALAAQAAMYLSGTTDVERHYRMAHNARIAAGLE